MFDSIEKKIKMSITVQQVLEALKNVDDPDLKKDLVTLGMIKDLEVNGKNVNFTVVLTTPACPMKEMIHKACVNAVLHFVDKEAVVNVKMTSNVTSSSKSKYRRASVTQSKKYYCSSIGQRRSR